MLPYERLVRSVKRSITNDEEVIFFLQLADGSVVEVAVDLVVKAILQRAIASTRKSDPGFFDSAELRMGCPAMWLGPRRERFCRIAADAGLDLGVADLLDEPIAAGISWVWDAWQRAGEWPSGNVIVFDYGGGTLDVACLQVHGAERPEITVLAAEGDSRGGR